MKTYNWNSIKRKALHSVPYDKHELIIKYLPLANIIALDTLLKGGSRSDITKALEQTIKEAEEAIMRWDIRNASLLIMATRKHGNYIVPKSFDLDYEIDAWMEDSEDSDWVLCQSNRLVPEIVKAQREAYLSGALKEISSMDKVA